MRENKMTIKMTEPTFADKALKILGKKRGVILPSGEYEKLGPYTYSVGKKESFLKALFRPSNEPLPNGMVDIHTFISQHGFSGENEDKEKKA
jgi:hypothetical protein